MLLTIDVGNTNIAVGLVDDNDKVVDSFRLMTSTPRTSDEYVTFLLSFLESANVDKDEIDDVLLSSVVPKVNHTIASGIVKTFGITPILIDSNTDTGIKIKVENPKEVGADLLVDMAAAYDKYKDSCLVLDFGTATTFTYVTKKGEFKYCIIAPGLSIFANILTGNTAKLPEIEIEKPKTILAANTIDAMKGGVMYGYIGLVENIIKTMKKEIDDKNCKVIATGGLGRVMSELTKLIDEYDSELAYKGMTIIYNRMKRKKK